MKDWCFMIVTKYRLKLLLISTIVVLLHLWLTGCQHHWGDMKAADMRAAIDNCHQNQLGVLTYQRADQSIMAIRCMPLPSDVNHKVTVRKRTNMPIFRVLTETIDIVDGN